MPRSLGDRFLRNTVLSGSVNSISATAGAAANNATGQYVVGGLTSGRRVVPGTSNTTSVNPPSVGTAQADQGWRLNPGVDALNNVTFAAGSWPLKLRYLRSGGADQSTRITAILYRVDAAGAFEAEIARDTLDVTYTTTLQSVTLPFASLAAQAFSADDRLQVEIYLQTLTAGVPTAPVVTSTMNLQVRYNEAEPNAAKVTPPDYTTQFLQSLLAQIALAAAMNRQLTLHRTLAVPIALVAGFDRRLMAHRTLTAAIGLLASQQKKVGLPRSASITLLASRGPSRVQLRRLATVTLVPAVQKRIGKRFNATVTLVSNMARVLFLRRSVSAQITLLARGWAKLPLNKIPGGAQQIIRRVIHIWED